MSEQLNGAAGNRESRSKLAGKYLTFALSEERYGIAILKIQEIIGVPHITQVPRSAPYIKGVINLRGKIIPIIDLRLKFNLPEIPYDQKTCVIVVDADLNSKKVSIGLIVDTVLEVVNFEGSRIEAPPNYGTKLETRFLTGIGRLNDQEVVILIDIERALESAATLLPSDPTITN